MCDIWFLRNFGMPFLSISGTILVIVGIFGSLGVKFKVKLNLKVIGRSCSEWVIHPTQIAIVSNTIFSEWVIWEQHYQSIPKCIKGKSKWDSKIVENDIILEVYPGSQKDLRGMACCKRLAGGNHLYIYAQTQPRWTTLQTFCRKFTKSENQKWPPHTFCLYNFWTGCSNLMCDTSFLMPYIYPFRATYLIDLAHI